MINTYKKINKEYNKLIDLCNYTTYQKVNKVLGFKSLPLIGVIMTTKTQQDVYEEKKDYEVEGMINLHLMHGINERI